MEHRWNEIDRGKPKYSGKKTCPSATLSNTNPTWTDPGSNLGLRGERLATNRLSHDTVLVFGWFPICKHIFPVNDGCRIFTFVITNLFFKIV
jgi:hypothetical protein